MNFSEIYKITLVLLLIVCAVSVNLTRSLLRSVIIFMSYSSIMCLLWILMESPDLAITEAAVGAGVSGYLFLVTLKKLRQIDGMEDGQAEGGAWTDAASGTQASGGALPDSAASGDASPNGAAAKAESGLTAQASRTQAASGDAPKPQAARKSGSAAAKSGGASKAQASRTQAASGDASKAQASRTQAATARKAVGKRKRRRGKRKDGEL